MSEETQNNNFDISTCLICGKEMKDQRTFKMHISFNHGIKADEYFLKYFYNDVNPICKCGCGQNTTWNEKTSDYNKYINRHAPMVAKVDNIDLSKISVPSTAIYGEPTFDYCLICNHKTENKKSLAMHTNKKHNIDMKEYVTKFFYNGSPRKCECGCGKNTEWHPAGVDYRRFITGHNAFTNEKSFINGTIPITKESIEKRVESFKKTVALKFQPLHEQRRLEKENKKILYIEKQNLKQQMIEEEKQRAVKDGSHTRCEICDELVVNNKKSIYNHYYYMHQELINEDFMIKFDIKKSKLLDMNNSKKIERTIECKICNKLVSKQDTGLGYHVKNEHGISWKDYLKKYYLDGIWPTCKCGCGQDVNKVPGKHTNEIMFYDYVQGHGPVNGVKNIKISNPFTNRQEIMHSGWEEKFMNKCIDKNISATKIHGYKIKYFDLDLDKEREYWPDFFLEESSTIVEIKGRMKEDQCFKMNAAEKYCKENGLNYLPLTYNKSKDEFTDIGFVSRYITGKIKPIFYGNENCISYLDKTLTIKNIEAFSLEERKNLANYIFEYYRKYGFPYPKDEKDELKEDFKNLLNCQITPEEDGTIKNHLTYGNRIFYNYSPQFFETSGVGEKSMIEAFNNDETLMKVILNRLGVTYKEVFNMHGAMIRQGFRSTRSCSTTSIFNCAVSKSIWEEFCPDENSVVLDYSTGFGQRLIGFMASSKGGKYIGCDPWDKQIESLNGIYELLREDSPCPKDIQLYNIGSENLPHNDHYKSVDFAFSSPPYFSKEIYEKDESQAYYNKSYNEFLEWWEKTVYNIDMMLKDNGKFGLNMVNILKIKNNQYPILDDMLNICAKFGWKESERRKLKMHVSHMNKAQNPNRVFKEEPIVIMTKI